MGDDYYDGPHFWEMRNALIKVGEEVGRSKAVQIIKEVGQSSHLKGVAFNRQNKVIQACKRALQGRSYFGEHTYNVPGLRDASTAVRS